MALGHVISHTWPRAACAASALAPLPLTLPAHQALMFAGRRCCWLWDMCNFCMAPASASPCVPRFFISHNLLPLPQVPLALRDMYNFCMAPASATDLRLASALLHFAAKYAAGAPVALDIGLPDRVPCNVEELRHLESAHQVRRVSLFGRVGGTGAWASFVSWNAKLGGMPKAVSKWPVLAPVTQPPHLHSYTNGCRSCR